MDYDLKYIIDDYNFEELGNAVVLQAVKDIRQVLLFEGLSDSNKVLSIRLYLDAKKFLLGKDFQIYTDLDGPVLLSKLIEENPKGYDRAHAYVEEKERQRKLHREAMQQAAMLSKKAKEAKKNALILESSPEKPVQIIRHRKKKGGV